VSRYLREVGMLLLDDFLELPDLSLGLLGIFNSIIN
jgi:hypothetical protein